MFDPVTILGLVSLALLVTGAGGYLLNRRRPGPDLETPTGETVVPISEWKTTGKIDFGCSELPDDERASAVFVLRCEEYRMLQSSSGARRLEFRWREATLAEAKQVTAVHNARRPNWDESGVRLQQRLLARTWPGAQSPKSGQLNRCIENVSAPAAAGRSGPEQSAGPQALASVVRANLPAASALPIFNPMLTG